MSKMGFLSGTQGFFTGENNPNSRALQGRGLGLARPSGYQNSNTIGPLR